MSDVSTKVYTKEQAKELLYDLFGCRRIGTKGLRKLRANIEGTMLDIWEQNPRKNSEFAQRAREGARIAWIFKDNNFHGRVSDSEGIIIFDDEPEVQDEPADPLAEDVLSPP